LIKVKVGGGALKWIKEIIFLMRSTTLPKNLSPFCSTKYDEKTPSCFGLTPLVFCDVTLFGWLVIVKSTC
jgi:hypothetical protein